MKRRPYSSLVRVLLSVAICLVVLLASGCASLPPETATEPGVFNYDRADGELLVWFFFLEDNDRSGDAILVMFPNGETMLIDAGIEAAGNQMRVHLDRIGVTSITYAVGTHGHHDHIGGFLPILSSLPVDNFVTVNVPHDTNTYNRLMRTLNDLEVPVTLVEAGDSFVLSETVELQVINPPVGTTAADVPAGSGAAGLNNLSLTFRLDHGENSFLFTGDLYRPRESALVDAYPELLDVDVLKVPHHGESTSSSTAFVNAVSPEFAVITINIIQSLPIYRRYEKANARVLMTGLDGTVLLVSDGTGITALTERQRESESLF